MESHDGVILPWVSQLLVAMMSRGEPGEEHRGRGSTDAHRGRERPGTAEKLNTRNGGEQNALAHDRMGGRIQARMV